MIKKILKFEGSWCAPCKALNKTLSQEEFNDIEIVKIDIDEESNSELIGKYKIRSIPTLIYFKDGIEINTTVGNISKEQILGVFTE
jgi:thiol-disulfide isomerase/thioredoxin